MERRTKPTKKWDETDETTETLAPLLVAKEKELSDAFCFLPWLSVSPPPKLNRQSSKSTTNDASSHLWVLKVKSSCWPP
jgi:hypothetical protein